MSKDFESKQEARSFEEISEIVDFAKQELAGKKGQDIVSIDLSAKSYLADFFVLVSASSKPHVRALAEHVEEELAKKYKLQPVHIEGLETATWILLDYLDFVIHVFYQEDRDFYNLEKLWS